MTSQRQHRIRIFSLESIVIILSLFFAGIGTYFFWGNQRPATRTDVMEQRLRNLEQLKTVSQRYRSVIFIQEKRFLRGRKQVLFTLEYEVTAGVDFSRGIEIKPMPNSSVMVRMPKAEIFSSDADETTIREMFLHESRFFNPIRMGDYMPQVIAQGEANRDAALESGILNRAETNAQLAVIRALQLAQIQNISFGPPLSFGSADG